MYSQHGVVFLSKYVEASKFIRALVGFRTNEEVDEEGYKLDRGAFEVCRLSHPSVVVVDMSNPFPVFVNGKVCKDPKLATPDDFFFHGLDIPGNTKNTLGSNVTLVDVQRLPGENTLGVAVARLDFAVHGLNPPHAHPRATEILTVLEGTLLVGFVSSNPDNRLFAKKLNKGDVYLFPKGMIHFQFNVGDVDAVALAGFDSQSPGLIIIADAVFGADPPISGETLAKAFQLDEKTVEVLQAKFGKKSK